MPWTASLDGRIIDLRDERSGDRVAMHDDRSIPWTCRGCGGPMHLRYYDQGTDRDPTRFRYFTDRTGPFLAFVHNAGEAERCRALGFHTDESIGHLDLKHKLACHAQTKGWTAETEVYHELPDGKRCRADVVITHPTEPTRVLEAQLSPLGTEKAIERTHTYRAAFGRTLWTHTKQRPWSRRLPSLRVDDEDLDTVVGGIYLDQGCVEPARPHDLGDALAVVLPPDQEMHWVFPGGDEWGGFTRLGSPGRPGRRRTRRTARADPAARPAGAAVRECPALDELEATDNRLSDPRYVAPDGSPWCHYGGGVVCLNGPRCLNRNHRVITGGH